MQGVGCRPRSSDHRLAVTGGCASKQRHCGPLCTLLNALLSSGSFPAAKRQGSPRMGKEKAGLSWKPKENMSSPGYGVPTKTFLFLDRSVIASPAHTASQAVLVVKNPPANAGDSGWIPGWGRVPGEGHVNPLQDSCRENPTDGGAWRATVHGVTNSQTRLSTELMQPTCMQLILSSPDYPCRQNVQEQHGAAGGATETFCCVFPLLYYHLMPSPPPVANPCSTHSKVNHSSFLRTVLYRLQSKSTTHCPNRTWAGDPPRTAVRIHPTLLQSTPPHPQRGCCK